VEEEAMYIQKSGSGIRPGLEVISASMLHNSITGIGERRKGFPLPATHLGRQEASLGLYTWHKLRRLPVTHT
jgi:hypothetical protein